MHDDYSNYQDPYQTNGAFSDEPPPAKKGHPWLAWLLILALVGLWVVYRPTGEDRAEDEEDRLAYILEEIQGRVVLGARELAGPAGGDPYEQIQLLNQGSVGQRLRFIVLAGEIRGPDAAAGHVHELRQLLLQHQRQQSAKEARLLDILDNLYHDLRLGYIDFPAVPQADREYLRQELGWLGDLALAPSPAWWQRPVALAAGWAPALALEQARPDNAREYILEDCQQAITGIAGAFTVVVFLGLCGFVGLVVFLSRAGQGRVEGGIQTGIPHGGVYAETFALWLILFSIFHASVHLADFVPAIFGMGLATLSSLLALCWPVWRGVSWEQVREDIGWTWGSNPSIEPFMGVASYAMTLPLAALGFAGTLIWLALDRTVIEVGDPFAPSGAPMHPILEPLQTGGLIGRLQVIFLACVAAPIVEETMFRGVLYRQLREASAWLRTGLSVLFSGLVVSLIFAVIHPQGMFAVPVLTALAFGFTLAREWRGTLIPSMVAHAINNGLVTFVAITALGR